MTPQEKAQELFTKFSSNTVHYDAAKQCAIIAVDEILNSIPSSGYWHTYSVEIPSAITYWQEVKQELENFKNK